LLCYSTPKPAANNHPRRRQRENHQADRGREKEALVLTIHYFLPRINPNCIRLLRRGSKKVKEDKMIKNGSVVSFEYTIFDENGKVIDSSRGKEPVTYTHGQQQIIPGLEKKLSGMEINEEKNVRLPPEEAFGPVDPNGFQEVPKDNIPAEDLKVGTTVLVRGRQGEDLDLRVHEIRKETVVLDLNHPLAGKTLNFGVKVLDIQPGESE
jgi:FKBP-type peptidyl-prolyl cis-trans isomerase SlyD